MAYSRIHRVVYSRLHIIQTICIIMCYQHTPSGVFDIKFNHLVCSACCVCVCCVCCVCVCMCVPIPARHLVNSDSYFTTNTFSFLLSSFSFSYRLLHSSAVSSSFTDTLFLMALALATTIATLINNSTYILGGMEGSFLPS